MRQKKDWVAVKGDGTPGHGVAVVLQLAVDREQRERADRQESNIYCGSWGNSRKEQERAGKILKRKGESRDKWTRVKRGKEKRK
jgi:hypothetical protein